jgi:hypothetical protein
MTTLVWREEVSANAPGKRVFSERCVLAGGEPAPSGANGNTVDRYRLKPLQRAVVGLYASWKRRVKTEISA